MQSEKNRMDFNQQTIFFLDIDGTIKPFGKPPSLKMLGAVRILHRNGHLAFLCTGRPRWEIPSNLLSAGFNGIIGLAGACVEVFGQMIEIHTVSLTVAWETVDLLLRTGADCILQRWDGACHLGPGVPDVSLGENIPSLHTKEQVLMHPECLRFSKFSFQEDQLPLLQKEEFLRGTYTLSKCSPDFYEMSLRGITKGRGVWKVLEFLQHGKENTWSFGDSENDIDMFKATEFSVAMGNADEEVKSSARIVTKSAEEDGVYSTLREFGFL